MNNLETQTDQVAQALETEPSLETHQIELEPTENAEPLVEPFEVDAATISDSSQSIAADSALEDEIAQLKQRSQMAGKALRHQRKEAESNSRLNQMVRWLIKEPRPDNDGVFHNSRVKLGLLFGGAFAGIMGGMLYFALQTPAEAKAPCQPSVLQSSEAATPGETPSPTVDCPPAAEAASSDPETTNQVPQDAIVDAPAIPTAQLGSNPMPEAPTEPPPSPPQPTAGGEGNPTPDTLLGAIEPTPPLASYPTPGPERTLNSTPPSGISGGYTTTGLDAPPATRGALTRATTSTPRTRAKSVTFPVQISRAKTIVFATPTRDQASESAVSSASGASPAAGVRTDALVSTPQDSGSNQAGPVKTRTVVFSEPSQSRSEAAGNNLGPSSPNQPSSAPSRSVSFSAAQAPNSTAPKQELAQAGLGQNAYPIGSQVQAKLRFGFLAVEGHNEVPVVAESADGTVWLGQAGINKESRVEVHFVEAYIKNQAYACDAQAYHLDKLPGLIGTSRYEAPNLVADLLQASIGGVSSYVQDLTQRATTTSSGGVVTTSRNSGPTLGQTVLGRAASLFDLPKDAKALIRLVEVPAETPFMIVVLPKR
jgi:hypothetical protein